MLNIQLDRPCNAPKMRSAGSRRLVLVVLVACAALAFSADQSRAQDVQPVLVPRLGLTLARLSGGWLEVKQVAAGSPAGAAGIVVGDVIYSVNGNSSKQTDFASVTAEGFGSLTLGVLHIETKAVSTVQVQEVNDLGTQWVGVRSLGLDLIYGASLPLTVADVTAGSQADRAGMGRADVIELVNGVPVKNMGDFFKAIGQDADKPSALVVICQFETGARLEVNLNVADGIGVVGTALANTGEFGLELESLTDRLLVSSVEADSPAARLGFKKQDFILRVDDQPVNDYQRSFAQMQSATILRPKPPQVLRLSVAGPPTRVQIDSLARVVNSLPIKIDLYWDPGGSQGEQFYAMLAPGAAHGQPTYLGDTWVVRKHDTQELVKRMTVTELKQLLIVSE